MLSVNINLVAFSSYHGNITGQIFTMFVLTVAAANNIQVGDVVEAAGVTAGTTVTGISGTDIT